MRVETMCYDFLKRVVLEAEGITMKYCGVTELEGHAESGLVGLRYYQHVLAKLLRAVDAE